MTISLAEINAVTLRVMFKPFAEEQLRALGVKLPTPWEPTDAELSKLAETFGKAMAEYDEDEA